MQTETKKGRPNSREDANIYETRLYKLLVEKLPTEFIKLGRIDTDRLSSTTGNARFTVYRWFHEQYLSSKAARSLLKISNETDDTEKKGVLTRDDLVPFVLGF